ncbi:MAG: CCA tRNA nucleotidyltransferase [Roseburia sp.]
MQIQLPEKVNTIIDCLEQAGYEAYAVGGCVRDTLLHRVPGDWDITTSAKPMEVKKLFRRTIDTGIEHGTVTVMLDKEGFEVTTYRIDGEYEDARHPKQVAYTKNLLEDLKRRDFTINAMAYNKRDGLIDAFGGIEDLKKGVIRCVGNPMHRFSEDALRMLRAVRFAAQLGFSIEENTKKAIVTLAPNLSKISAERIQVEFVKLLTSNHPEELRTLYETGITGIIFPEFDVMMKEEQHNPHHCYTVGEHTIAALCNIKADKVLRLTMLLHDIAKPVCKTVDEKRICHYYGHPKKGAEMAREFFNRLKFDSATRDKVCCLVQWHDDNPPLEEQMIRKAIHRIGTQCYPALFQVKRADILAQSDYERDQKLAYVDAYEKMYGEIIEKGQCLTLKELAVTGSDLIKLGMKPGKVIGETLNDLLQVVLEHPEKNKKEILLEIVQLQQKK